MNSEEHEAFLRLKKEIAELTSFLDKRINGFLYSGIITPATYISRGGSSETFKKFCKDHGKEPPDTIVKELVKYEENRSIDNEFDEDEEET